MHYHFDSARSIKKGSHMEVKIEAVKRLDHLGIVAGIMKDLGVAKIIDELLGVDKQEEVSACKKEKVNLNVGHCDTTSHSLTGEYDVDSDTERIEVTYGHSKAKRPDLKQVVQELMTS